MSALVLALWMAGSTDPSLWTTALDRPAADLDLDDPEARGVRAENSGGGDLGGYPQAWWRG